MTKILLVYPEYPKNTYWSFDRSLKYLNKKASMPPLGLITVAALLPKTYELRLVDMNIESLKDSDIKWADYVFTSTMIVQADSLKTVIKRANKLNVPVIAGGPYPTAMPELLTGVSCIVQGEAEMVLPQFLQDLEKGALKTMYSTENCFPDITISPLPRFDLLKQSAYANMTIQYSRGCPHHCEFCDIWQLYGQKTRVKDAPQFLKELDLLHALKWSGSVFIVDDNFIGNPRRVKPFLKELSVWQETHQYPFSFFTEATINLASDDELLNLMRDAGFNMVFLGLETPEEESLKGTQKTLNLRHDLLTSVKKIQKAGLEVSGGFIVGFDEDKPNIFKRQIRFIQKANIPMAMVGLLTAIPGTELYKRLRRENRLVNEETVIGNNTHQFTPNFKTKLPSIKVSKGYRHIISKIYDKNLKNYFKRCRGLLANLGKNPHFSRPVRWFEVKAFFLSLKTIFTKRFGLEYARFLIWCVSRRICHFPEAVRLGIMGFHFHSITHEAIRAYKIEIKLLKIKRHFAKQLKALNESRETASKSLAQLYQKRLITCRRMKRKIKKLHFGFQANIEIVYEEFLKDLDAMFENYVVSIASSTT